MNARSRPILLIQHAPHEHPAALRRALATQGIPVRWIHPYRGDAYPDVGEIGGIISLGGPMSSNDETEHGWIRPEIRLLQGALHRKLPILGICLGGQLLARALGKRVFANPVAEVGWFPLDLTAAGRRDRIFSAAPGTPTVYHFHFETFETPEGAGCLARSDGCERQAYKLDEQTYGLQFHPEADHQLLAEWMALDGFDQEIREIQARFGEKTVQSSDVQLALATEAELNSIPLVTAFSSLFRAPDHPTGEADESLFDEVENWRDLRIPVETEMVAADGRAVRIRGVIERTFTHEGREFLILRGEDQLVWPIRLDDLKRITPVSK